MQNRKSTQKSFQIDHMSAINCALHVPPLNEAANYLQRGLQKTFKEVKVEVVQCPNLKEKPFTLAAEGLCGNPVLLDVGGVPYLIPTVQPDKVYNIKNILTSLGFPNAFVIGAGAGPRHHIGVNCEFMGNVKLGEEDGVKSYIAKIGKDNECVLQPVSDNVEFCLLGNLFASDGKPGEVIKVTARCRVGSDNIVTAMRNILEESYKDDIVGIGGVFLIKRGKAKLHVMPDYSKTPLDTNEDVNYWLKFFNMSAPLVCLSTFINDDLNLGIRVEHTHCFSDHREGGHYHEDTTPDTVEYEGYFNVATCMYRVDPPPL